MNDKEKAEGIPVMGGFADDDPYKDFDTNEGIFTIFEYYDPYSILKVRPGGTTVGIPSAFCCSKFIFLNGP